MPSTTRSAGRTGASDEVEIPLLEPQGVATVSGERWRVRGARGRGAHGVVLAHGAGSSRRQPLLREVAAGLQAAGHPVLLFNFAYSEAGRRGPDAAPRLLAVWRDVAKVAPRLLAVRGPLVLGGRSMGGRMATMAVAEGLDAAGLVLLAYPLHLPGRHDRLRTDHWPALDVPMLFVHGDRDAFNDLVLFTHERPKLAHAAVSEHLLPGADHGFRVRKSDGFAQADVVPAVVAAVDRWLRAIP